MKHYDRATAEPPTGYIKFRNQSLEMKDRIPHVHGYNYSPLVSISFFSGSRVSLRIPILNTTTQRTGYCYTCWGIRLLRLEYGGENDFVIAIDPSLETIWLINHAKITTSTTKAELFAIPRVAKEWVDHRIEIQYSKCPIYYDHSRECEWRI